MNIWILSHYAHPPDSPGGTRHYDFSRELIKHGHKVTIFASGFSHRTRKQGKPVSIYGDGNQRYDFIHVSDIAHFVVKMLDMYPDGWNDIYNIGAGGSVSLNELVGCLAEIAAELGLPPVSVEQYLYATSNAPIHLELDITRARTRLGWTPHQPLQEGLREYLMR